MSTWKNPRLDIKYSAHVHSWHAKTGLKIFVIAIPKEGLATTSPAKPSFGTVGNIMYEVNRVHFVVSVIEVWHRATAN